MLLGTKSKEETHISFKKRRKPVDVCPWNMFKKMFFQGALGVFSRKIEGFFLFNALCFYERSPDNIRDVAVLGLGSLAGWTYNVDKPFFS